MAPVVLVGLRTGALDAAERLGRPVVAVVEAVPGPTTRARLADVVVAQFDASPEVWAEVAGRLRPYAPAAVVGATERSVVPAARLRASLGLGGISVEAARKCSDKRAMKRAVRAAGLRCAEVVEASDGLSGKDLVARLGLPMVLKTAVGSGGRGTRILRDVADMPDGLAPGEMAEAFVDGVEMSVETLVAGGEALFWNPTQYLEPAWSSLAPAPLSDDVMAAVRAHSEAARRALGVETGMTHLELFLTPEGPVFGEMAARPPGGHLMRLIERAYGFDPWEAWLRIALGERPDVPTEAAQAAAVRILHPGPGTVRRVEGVEAARAVEGVEEVAVRVRPGDAVPPREGTGQEVGRVVVTAETPEEAAARLAAAVAPIRLEVDGGSLGTGNGDLGTGGGGHVP